MSKAFTKDEDDAGFVPPAPTALALPDGPLRLTHAGAAKLAAVLAAVDDPRAKEALARAEVLPPVPLEPERAALGVTVRVRPEDLDEERVYRLVTPEEYAIFGEGCSIASPLGRALLGAEVSDVRTVRAPRGKEELEVVALVGEPAND